jgi:hypothetical protein
MKKPAKFITDGLEIIDQAIYLGKPERQAQLERAKADDAVARKMDDLRTKAGFGAGTACNCRQKSPHS